MHILDLATQFAEIDPEKNWKEAVIDSYVEGYNIGHYEAMASHNHPKVSLDFEFIDLGLPSGTLWASDYINTPMHFWHKMNFKEAQRFILPTKEQWEELLHECKLTPYKYGLKITGKNGNEITLELTDLTGFFEDFAGYVQFWIDSEINSEQKAIYQSCKILFEDKKAISTFGTELAWHDKAVLLVRNLKNKVKIYGHEFEF